MCSTLTASFWLLSIRPPTHLHGPPITNVAGRGWLVQGYRSSSGNRFWTRYVLGALRRLGRTQMLPQCQAIRASSDHDALTASLLAPLTYCQRSSTQNSHDSYGRGEVLDSSRVAAGLYPDSLAG
ncbi:hypothetical protein V8E36_005119 [Tilletia maclaganii]